MSNVKQFFATKKYSIIVLLIAVTLGLINVVYYPYINFLVKSNYSEDVSFAPFNLDATHDEATVYFARFREVFSGAQLIVRDWSIAENKDSPYLLPPLSALLVGLIMRLTDNYYYGFLLAKFLFTSGIFLLLYWLFRQIINNKLYCSFVSLCFMAIWRIGIMIPFISFLPLKFNFPQRLSLIDRLDAPLITSLFYILFFGLNIYLIQNKKAKNIILAGISFGLLFYVYFYYWIYATVVLGLFVLFLFFRKNSLWRKFVLEIIIGYIISIPFWVNYFLFNRLPQANDIVMRLGLELGRNIRWHLISFYLISALLFFLVYKLFYAKGKKELSLLYFSFLIAGTICLNLQVVTGFMPHPDHWIGYGFSLPFWIIWGHLIYYISTNFCNKLKQKEKIFNIILISSSLIILALLMFNKYHFSNLNYDRFILPTDVKESFEWLEKNTEKDSIIATPSFTSNYYLNIYTNNNILSPSGDATFISNKEMVDRFLYTANIFNISEKTIQNIFLDKVLVENPDYVDKIDRNISKTLYVNYYYPRSFNSTFFPGDRIIPEKVIEENMRKYNEINQNKTHLEFNYDYIYFGPFEKKLIKKDRFKEDPSYTIVYQNKSVIVYKKN